MKAKIIKQESGPGYLITVAETGEVNVNLQYYFGEMHIQRNEPTPGQEIINVMIRTNENPEHWEDVPGSDLSARVLIKTLRLWMKENGIQ